MDILMPCRKMSRCSGLKSGQILSVSKPGALQLVAAKIRAETTLPGLNG